MEEYVDVFSDRYTKMWKTIAIVRLSLKILLLICFVITLAALCQGLTPYIKGDEVWEEMPFTLSQLEAILTLSVFAYMGTKAMSVIYESR